MVLGKMGKSVMIRRFSLVKFDEKKARGYVKLIGSENGLLVQVLDTYNQESPQEELEYIAEGYVKIGYPRKKVEFS